jgi:hypothetical protein
MAAFSLILLFCETEITVSLKTPPIHLLNAPIVQRLLGGDVRIPFFYRLRLALNLPQYLTIVILHRLYIQNAFDLCLPLSGAHFRASQ